MNNFEGSKEAPNLDLSLLCDIDLDFYLVPKVWVKEIVLQMFLSCLVDLLRIAEANHMDSFLIENAINKVKLAMIAKKKTFFLEVET